MALADLMKKGFLTSATATPAALATHREINRLSAASVATVAVAKPLKSRIAMPTVATVAGVAVAKGQEAKTAIDAELLALFRFDLVQAEIDAGNPADELRRVNNMAWEFMQADQMAFSDAIRCAAEIVAGCNVAACEAAYVDAQELWRQISGAQSVAQTNLSRPAKSWRNET